MARVELNGPIASLRGALSKESGVCFRVINGKTYMTRKAGWRESARTGGWVKPKQKAPTKQQMSQQERFRQAQEMTQAIMTCAGLRRYFEEQWKRQKQYVTLRGFVSARMMKLC